MILQCRKFACYKLSQQLFHIIADKYYEYYVVINTIINTPLNSLTVIEIAFQIILIFNENVNQYFCNKTFSTESY